MQDQTQSKEKKMNVKSKCMEIEVTAQNLVSWDVFRVISWELIVYFMLSITGMITLTVQKALNRAIGHEM